MSSDNHNHRSLFSSPDATVPGASIGASFRAPDAPDAPAAPAAPGAASPHPALAALGLDADRAAEAAALARPGDVLGRVGRVDRSSCDVVTGDRVVRAAYGDGPPPCTGDWVLVTPGAGDPPTAVTATVTAILERRTAMVRGAASGRSHGQVLAANVDVVLVVVPLDVTPDLGRAERLLTLAWESGARPVVVLTKADTSPDPDGDRAVVESAAPGVDVLTVSAPTGDGLDVLTAVAGIGEGVTLALVGTSGAGKSTLVNALAGTDLATAAVRGDGKGRHTTTWRELVPLPGGGVLIDTPGLRGVALFDVGDGLDRTFADIDELAAECRFDDCAHAGEPGCAVLAAVAGGVLTERRLDSYRKLVREAEWMASREDHRLRAERTRRWKIIHKEMRRNPSPRKH